jgi:hypothetical protein
MTIEQNLAFDDCITWDLKTAAGRDYAIMYIAEVGCTVVGIDDPTLYDSAGVSLRESERCAMIVRLLQGSYTELAMTDYDMQEEEVYAYDLLIDLYESRYYAARDYENQKRRIANEDIQEVCRALFQKVNATIH